MSNIETSSRYSVRNKVAGAVGVVLGLSMFFTGSSDSRAEYARTNHCADYGNTNWIPQADGTGLRGVDYFTDPQMAKDCEAMKETNNDGRYDNDATIAWTPDQYTASATYMTGLALAAGGSIVLVRSRRNPDSEIIQDSQVQYS